MTTPSSPTEAVAPESDAESRRTFVWNRYNAKSRERGPADPQVRRMAAAARRANGVEPGTNPDVWPLYRTADYRGNPISWESTAFGAEHLAIGLWGLHQQGNPRPMHVQGENLGKACLTLFHHTNKNDAPVLADMDDAISRRLKVIARSKDVAVAARHLKSLVNFLGSEAIPTDYTNLFFALVNWNDQNKHSRDLRTWASSYQRTKKNIAGKTADVLTQKD